MIVSSNEVTGGFRYKRLPCLKTSFTDGIVTSALDSLAATDATMRGDVGGDIFSKFVNNSLNFSNKIGSVSFASGGGLHPLSVSSKALIRGELELIRGELLAECKGA